MGVDCPLLGDDNGDRTVGLLVGVMRGDGGGGRELRLEVLGQLFTSPNSSGGGGGGRESRLKVLPAKSGGGGNGSAMLSKLGDGSSGCSRGDGGDGSDEEESTTSSFVRWTICFMSVVHGMLPCLIRGKVPTEILSSVCDLLRLILAPLVRPRLPTTSVPPLLLPMVSYPSVSSESPDCLARVRVVLVNGIFGVIDGLRLIVPTSASKKAICSAAVGVAESERSDGNPLLLPLLLDMTDSLRSNVVFLL